MENKIKHECEFCKKIFYSWGKRRFCSHICYWKSMEDSKRAPRTEETKAKISSKNSGSGNGRWTGGTRKKNGYISIYSPDHPFATKCGYVAEHRLVMEKRIGRYLNSKEQVHHIDFNRSNNDIENLMLFPSCSAHMKFHIKIRQHGITGPIRRQIKNRWNNINQ